MKKIVGLFLIIAMMASSMIACTSKKVEDEISDSGNIEVEDKDENKDDDKDQVVDLDKADDKDEDKDKIIDKVEDEDKDKITSPAKVQDKDKDKNKDKDKDKITIPDKVEDKIIDLNEIHEAVKESLGENYISNMPMDFETIESFTGIKESDIESYIAESPMMSTNVDTFIAIKSKDKKANLIKEGLVKYRKYLVEESMQYPMNMAKVKAAKVVQHGDYVFFLMLGKYDDRDHATEAQMLEFAQEEVQKIEDVISGFFK